MSSVGADGAEVVEESFVSGAYAWFEADEGEFEDWHVLQGHTTGSKEFI